MSEGFDIEWLTLREPADHEARARGAIERALAPRARWRGLDLGGGTGSNLRYLLPRLGAHQDWLLVDHDRRLLAVAAARFSSWAAAHGFDCLIDGEVIAVTGPDWSAQIRLQQADLVAFPELTIPGYPPEDLLLKPSFVAANQHALQKAASEVNGPLVSKAESTFVNPTEFSKTK